MRRYFKYAAAAAAVLLGTAGAAAAYMADSDHADNALVIGHNVSEIGEHFPDPDDIPENGGTYEKEVKVRNSESVPCYARVRISSQRGKIGTEIILEDPDLQNWFYISEEEDKLLGGYYYYRNPLDPGQETSALFQGVTFAQGIEEMFPQAGETLDIFVYEETVQKGEDSSCMSAWSSFIRE